MEFCQSGNVGTLIEQIVVRYETINFQVVLTCQVLDLGDVQSDFKKRTCFFHTHVFFPAKFFFVLIWKKCVSSVEPPSFSGRTPLF